MFKQFSYDSLTTMVNGNIKNKIKKKKDFESFLFGLLHDEFFVSSFETNLEVT